VLEDSLARSYDQARGISTRPFRAACYSPFNSMFFDTAGVVRACCLNSDYTLGDLKYQRLDAIWNGPRARSLRDAMRRYDLRLGCQQCQGAIERGNFSNEHATLSSIHAIKYDAFPIVEREGAAPWPTNLEFNLSNVCNLECVMCNGDLSSLIRSKREHRPPMPHVYDDTFFRDLDPYLPRIQSAQFLGGEPFLIQEHFRVWERMAAVARPIWVGIVTNGTIWNERVERVLASLPVSIAMSIDGITKESFESIRVNARLEVFLENCERFLAYHRAAGRPMTFNWTLSTLNYHEFADFLLFADARQCDVTVCTLMAPESFCLYKLETAELRKVLETMERRDGEMQRSLHHVRHVWNNSLANLRAALAEHPPAAPAAPAANDPPPAPRSAVFGGLLAGSRALQNGDGERAAAEARAALRAWSGGGVDELLTDPDEKIVAAGERAGTVVPHDVDLLGRRLDEVRAHVAQIHGGEGLLARADERDRIDWTVRYGEGGGAPIELRSVVLPRFDGAGERIGLRVLLALRPLRLRG
jgi:MoaA/NifB/PqqE/SkfB family radical SAM enzyme